MHFKVVPFQAELFITIHACVITFGRFHLCEIITRLVTKIRILTIMIIMLTMIIKMKMIMIIMVTNMVMILVNNMVLITYMV